MSSKNAIYVGIDLGTSQSAIAASNGERHVVRSFVGWPADMVARKVLKRDVLIGDEALEARTMLDLHRPLERGLIREGSEKDLEAVRELLRHLLEQAGVAKDPTNIRAVVGVPAEAQRVSKEHLRGALKGLVGSLMIVSEPFAVAYGEEALLHTMIIDIGAGTVDFCVMEGRYPTEEDQRTLTTAGDHIDAQLHGMLTERHLHAKITIHMVRAWKEANSFVGKRKDRVKVTAPVDGKPTQFDITDELRTACESIVPPISETMLDLVARVEPEYQEAVRNSILLSGCTSLTDGLDKALEEALQEVGGGKVKRVKDPVFAGANGGLSIAIEAPDGDWDKLSS